MCSFYTFTFFFCSLTINIGLIAAEHITISPSCGASSCVTLAQYTPSTSDNITLSLLPGDHVVSSTVRFEQKEYVAVQGHDPRLPWPVVRCTGQDVNLKFVRINMLQLQHVIIVNCVVVVECTANQPDTNQVRMSYLMLTASNRLVMNITLCASVNVSYSTFQSQAYEILHINRVSSVEISYCNFTDIRVGYFGSVVAFDEINQVHFLQCDIRNITGKFLELRSVNDIHIEFSTFDGNFFGRYGTSLVDMSSTHTALISCSTFSNNVVNYRGDLISGSHLAVMNSTFAHNNLRKYGSFIEYAISCSVIGSVFENNVGPVFGHFVDRASLLASNFAHNNGIISYAQKTTIDCTYFANNTSIPTSSQYRVVTAANSTACNQLLLTDSRGVCQRDRCRGKYVCLQG